MNNEPQEQVMTAQDWKLKQEALYRTLLYDKRVGEKEHDEAVIRFFEKLMLSERKVGMRMGADVAKKHNAGRKRQLCEFHEEAIIEIRAEERGEDIASQEIARAILSAADDLTL